MTSRQHGCPDVVIIGTCKEYRSTACDLFTLISKSVHCTVLKTILRNVEHNKNALPLL